MDHVEARSRLVPMLFEGCTMQEILNACGELLGTPVRFSPTGTPERSLMSAHFDPINLDDLLADVYSGGKGLSPAYLHFMSRDYAQRGQARPFIINKPAYHHPRKLCWVTVGALCYGHLSVPEGAIPLAQIDDDLLMECSRCFGLCCQAHNLLHDLMAGDELLDALLTKRITTLPQLLSSSAGSMLLSNPTFRLFLFRPQSGVAEQILPHLHNELRATVSHAWYSFDTSGATMLVYDDLAAFPQTAKDKEQLCAITRRLHCSAIMSDHFSSLLNVASLCSQLRAVPAFLRAEEGMLVEYALHKECGLLATSPLSAEEMQELCSSHWLAVLDYDRHNATEYASTISAYLKNACSVKKTAEALFVHHNTVLYRLNRAETLFGIDLSNGDVLFSLMLSMRILDYLRERDPGR